MQAETHSQTSKEIMMPGVAGATIANAAGRPAANGTPWSALTITQPIGAYVESSSETRFAAATNYIGYTSVSAYKSNVLAQGNISATPNAAPQPDWQVPNNDNDVLSSAALGAQWVRAAGTIAEGGTCTVAAGAATAGAGTFECNVKGGVVANDFFWANVVAES